jgi:CubicO group peptidase (beta-lactamase class C family)
MLDRYEKEAGDHPTVEGALHAFLDTDLDLYREGGEPWMNSATFCARISNTPEGGVDGRVFRPRRLAADRHHQTDSTGLWRRRYLLGLPLCHGRIDVHLCPDRDTTWRKRPGSLASVGNDTGLVTSPRDIARFGAMILHDRQRQADRIERAAQSDDDVIGNQPGVWSALMAQPWQLFHTGAGRS